jgi:hypothetical protein
MKNLGTGHPTILNPQQGLSVLSRFAADFQHPTAREGFDRILYVSPSDHPSSIYTRSDIAAILRRVHDSPPVVQQQQNTRQGAYNSSRSGFSSFRGHLNRGHRSGGWGEPYQRVPRGRGGNLNLGPSYNFRGWRSPLYGGNGVGIHSSARGGPTFRGAPSNQSGSSAGPSRGAGTGEDPFVID